MVAVAGDRIHSTKLVHVLVDRSLHGSESVRDDRRGAAGSVRRSRNEPARRRLMARDGLDGALFDLGVGLVESGSIGWCGPEVFELLIEPEECHRCASHVET